MRNLSQELNPSNRISKRLEREEEERHFDPDTGKYYPPSHSRGGIISGYEPTEKERKNCAHAPEGYDCSQETTGPVGGKSHIINCAECPYHPINQRMG